MKKALKITLYILGGIILLVLIAFAWLNTGSGKSFVKKKVVSFLENKLETEVVIGTLDYSLPKMLELKDVLFRDQRKDTLLAVRRLRVDISMLKLLNSKVEVKEIQLEGGVMNIYRLAPDTAFNFDYIVKAFVAPPDPNKQDAPTDSTGQFQLDIQRLLVDDVRFTYDDQTGGMLFATNINQLILRMNKLDPYNMDFGIKDLNVNGLAATFIQGQSLLPEVPLDTAVVPMPLLAAEELNLRNISFYYQDKVSPMEMDYKIGILSGHPELIDLNNQKIKIKDLLLENSTGKITMGKQAAKEAEQLVDTLIDTDPAPAAKWYVSAGNTQFSNIGFVMDDKSMPRQPYGIDYAHLNISGLHLDLQDLVYTTDTITGNIRNLALKEQSGLDLQKLQTRFGYHPEGGYLRDLYVQTPNTVLRDYAEVHYPSLEALQTNMGLIHTRINLTQSMVGMSDVLLFAPQLRNDPLFRKYGNDKLKVEARMEGFVNALKIDRFIMQGLNSYVDISGRLNGLPDANKLNYNLSIARLQSNKDVVNTFLTPELQKQVDLPNTFNITGRVSGTATNYNTDLYATTSDGNATIKGTLSMGGGAGRERYNMALRTNKLNIGKIIRQPKTMGHITADVTAVGSSFDVNYMDAMLKGNIHSASFMGYAYTGISFDAKVKQKKADVNMVSKDPNAMLDLKGTADLTNKYPAIVARLNVDSIDLQALKLYNDELRFRGVIDADFPVMNPDYPQGTLTMNRPAMVFSGTRYFLDSMYVTSNPSADSGNHIIINADAIYAVISGRTPLTQIGNVVQSHINRHYALSTSDSAKAVAAAPSSYDLTLDATIRDRPLIYALLPGLKSMDTIHIAAGLTPHTMFVNADMPRLQYNNMLLQNGNVRVNGGDTGLHYDVRLDRFAQDRLEFWYTSATGEVYDGNISTRLKVSDTGRNTRFSLGAVLSQKGNTQELRVEDGLMLNYKTWAVSQPNSIVFGKDGFYVQNFKISKGGESISLNSETPSFSAPMTVAINDFLLSNVTEIISKDTLLADGVMNANIVARNLMTAPEATGDLSIRDLAVLNDTIGNLTAQLTGANANQIASAIRLEGRGNDISMKGMYYPTPVNGNNFDLDIDISALALRSIEGVTAYAVRNSSGYIRGNLKLQGTMEKPRITGQLRTDNLRTTVAALGTGFSMPNEEIRFTGDAIEFRNFELVDSLGNKGIVDGKIYMRDMTNMGLDLTVRANKWQAISSTAKDNELFYGTAIISTNMKVTGTMLSPNINGNLTVHDSTKFSVVLPQPEPGIEEREGVIEFVDQDDPNRYVLMMPKDTLPQLGLRPGISMNLNLQVEKDAEFNVIIDEASGDFVRIRGEGALNTTMNPDGTMGITGVYEIKSGAYELNYNFIRRRFDIQPGSTITFAGDPLDAVMNLTAVYTANVPPYDLVSQQVSSPEELVYFKQRLPFQVQLKLQGQLMKPSVGFDIVLPEDRSFRATADVVNLTQARLQEIRNDASELNKQVFAVLILGRFVGENPFESGAGGSSAEFIAKQSASRFIGDQLNRFADQLITGVDLTLDLQTSEDFTTGARRERTDLSVSASRRLLNDRLKVTVGNDFEVSGASNQAAAQNSSFIPSNLSLDYLLTPEGRYTVRLYRENNNRELLDRNVAETGSSFIIKADYNRFRQLFMRRKRMMNRNMRDQRWKEQPIDSTKQSVTKK